MANVVERPHKNGAITYQVRWREGGTRQGKQENEKFDDIDAANHFKKLVEAHGHHWPHGWVPGVGFVDPDTSPTDIPFVDWANRHVDRLTGIDELTRNSYRRVVRLHLSRLRHTLPSGLVVPATIQNLVADDVQDWVRLEEQGERDPDDPARWIRRKADPKSIRNWHGLLFSIVQAAVDAEPQLRTKNCCRGTKLPRVDDHVVEEMTFLEHDEYFRIAEEISDPRARDLVDWLVGTGMRWGEATAVQVRDVNLRGQVPTVTVQRAWKRAVRGSEKSYFVGAPKTRKARRTLALAPAQADLARRLVTGQPPEAFLFRTSWGNPWRHANFYNRKWLPAVQAAIEKGLPKRPRIHDLRHTHVAWLIAAKIPLPAIQVRLGHESITTTIDRYGHLVRELDAEIAAAVEQAFVKPAVPGVRQLAPVAG